MTVANINELPIEMLWLIIGDCAKKSPKDALRLRQICADWKSILDTRQFWASLTKSFTPVEWKELYHPLAASIKKSYKEAVERLLNIVPVDSVIEYEHDEAPVHIAAFECNEEMLALLVTHQASLNLRNLYGQTALYQAVSKGSHACADLLMKNGADPLIAANGLTEEEQLTPFKVAETKGDRVMQRILEFKASASPS